MAAKKTDSAPAARPSWGRRFLRMLYRSLRMLVLLVLLAAVLLLGYCRWMENFLEKQLHLFWSEDIFSVDQISFSPWTHEFYLYGLCWKNPPGFDRSRKAIEIRRIHVDLELDQITEGILHFKTVEISDIKLNMEFKSQSIAMLALMLNDPNPDTNLNEAIQFQLLEQEGDSAEGARKPLIRGVRIDTLAIGETRVTFGNIADIPGLNVVLNLYEAFSLRLAPYNRYGIGLEKEMTHGEALDDIISFHCHTVQSYIAQRLTLSSETLSSLYHETFSRGLRDCEKEFEAIRDWQGLVAAAKSIDAIEDQEELVQSLERFLGKYPHTQAVVKRLRDDFRAYKTGVISAEELRNRQDFLRRSRNAEQAIREWVPRDWWKFWK